jgi:hypothetical protein
MFSEAIAAADQLLLFWVYETIWLRAFLRGKSDAPHEVGESRI